MNLSLKYDGVEVDVKTGDTNLYLFNMDNLGDIKLCDDDKIFSYITDFMNGKDIKEVHIKIVKLE